MHKKRDRMVMVNLHKSTNDILLFPYVYHMEGESTAFGDAVELISPVDSASLGKEILKLLRACKKANIEAMKVRRMARLRANGNDGVVHKDENKLGPTWTSLLAKHPELTKGPGTFLRLYYVCQIFERDGLKSRNVVRVEKSAHRGCIVDGESLRVPISARPLQLGNQVMEFLSP